MGVWLRAVFSHAFMVPVVRRAAVVEISKMLAMDNAEQFATVLAPLFAIAKDRPLSDPELAELSSAQLGFSQHIGLRLTFVSADKVTAEIPVTQELLQVAGIVHGGVYCAIAETVGSIAGLAAAGGKPVVGISNSTNFLSSCASGVIDAEAITIHAGSSTQAFEIRCTHRGKLLSHTTLRTMVLRG